MNLLISNYNYSKSVLLIWSSDQQKVNFNCLSFGFFSENLFEKLDTMYFHFSKNN